MLIFKLALSILFIVVVAAVPITAASYALGTITSEVPWILYAAFWAYTAVFGLSVWIAINQIKRECQAYKREQFSNDLWSRYIP